MIPFAVCVKRLETISMFGAFNDRCLLSNLISLISYATSLGYSHLYAFSSLCVKGNASM